MNTPINLNEVMTFDSFKITDPLTGESKHFAGPLTGYFDPDAPRILASKAAATVTSSAPLTAEDYRNAIAYVNSLLARDAEPTAASTEPCRVVGATSREALDDAVKLLEAQGIKAAIAPDAFILN